MDKQLGTLTLEKFEQRFKALLLECEDSGLDVDEFCQLAEDILQSGWAPDGASAIRPQD